VLLGVRLARASDQFPSIFCFRVRNGLPLHILGPILAAARQRHNVIDDVARASSYACAGYGTRLRSFELSPCAGRAMNASVLVACASRAVLGTAKRK